MKSHLKVIFFGGVGGGGGEKEDCVEFRKKRVWSFVPGIA